MLISVTSKGDAVVESEQRPTLSESGQGENQQFNFLNVHCDTNIVALLCI